MEQSRNDGNNRRSGRRARPLELRKKLTTQKLEYMVCTVIRRLEAFSEAVNHLTPENFTDGERHFKVLWAATADFYKRYNRLPDRTQLTNELNDRIESDLEFTDNDIDELNTVLDMAFDDSVGYTARIALDYLKLFLEERLAAEMVEGLAVPTRLPSDFYKMATIYADRASAISTIGVKQTTTPFPEGWTLQSDPMNIIPTNITFIDDYLAGGHVPGQVQLYLGCYGGGKSLLAIQLSISVASVFWNRWVMDGRKGPLPLSYLVSYEDSIDEIRLRALAHCAEVPFDRLTKAQINPAVLSTTGRLLDYELERWRSRLSNGEEVPGERERLACAMAVLNRNWRVLDMSGQSGEQPGVGTGLHNELLSLLRRDMQDHSGTDVPVCCGSVVLDYVGAAVKKHIDHNGVDRTLMRHYVNEFPLHFKQRVLLPLEACGHIFHQYDTKHQGMAPGKVAEHSDAAEGKAIGENANFCFNIGKPGPEGLLPWSVSKCRRADRQQPPRILRLDGRFATLRETNGAYVFDARTSRIVSRDEAASVSGDIAGPSDGGYDAEVQYDDFGMAEAGSLYE